MVDLKARCLPRQIGHQSPHTAFTTAKTVNVKNMPLYPLMKIVDQILGAA